MDKDQPYPYRPNNKMNQYEGDKPFQFWVVEFVEECGHNIEDQKQIRQAIDAQFD